jgi:hypothetical protein
MKKWMLVLMLAPLLNACGEISYKRGATVQDLEQAHRACRGSQESELSGCLEKHGWKLQKFDHDPLFAEVSIDSNQQRSDPKKMRESYTPVETNQDKVAAIDQADNTTSHNRIPAKHDPSSQINTDPNQTYQINSWWKLGGTPLHLSNDQTQCASTLDKTHQPNYKEQLFTRAFVTCMREKGWRALRTSKY